MKNSLPLVYILILNWNGYKDTIDCIKSLEKIDYKNKKIVVIDNGSTNNSIEKITHKFPNTIIIQNKTNLGYSEGNNKGITFSLKQKADYILLLNNDTIVDKNFLTLLTNIGEKHEEIGLLSPTIFFADKPKLIYASGGKPNFKGPYPFYDEEYKKMQKKYAKEYKEVDTLIGCCLLIKRKVLETIGMLDKDYFLYAEDTDFSIRAKKAKFSLVTVHNAKIWHKVSGSSGGEGNKIKDYYDTRNLILLAKKHISEKDKKTYYYYFLKGRLHVFLIYLRKKKYSHAIAIAKGVIHGFLGIYGKMA